MTNEITEIAEANGATRGFIGGEPAHVTNMTWTFTKPELLALEQAILAKRGEEHERYASNLRATIGDLTEEIDHLKAQLAMQADAINYALDDLRIRANLSEDDSLNIGQGCLGQLHKSLSTTAEDVAKYKAVQKAENEKELLESLATDIDLNIGGKYYYLAEVVDELKLMAQERGGVR